jgi:thiol-disulfide isomerase/thioredoxin
VGVTGESAMISAKRGHGARGGGAAGRAFAGRGRRGAGLQPATTVTLATSAARTHARRTSDGQAARIRVTWYHVVVVSSVSVARVASALLVPVLGVAACAGQAPAPAPPPPPGPAPAAATSAPPVSSGPVDPDAPGWLGVELAAVPPGEAGVLVRDVVPGAPAAQAGIKAGDRILSVAGEAVLRPQDVVRTVSLHRAGERLSLGLERAGAPRLLAVALGARPNEGELLRSQFLGAQAPAWRELATVKGSLPKELSELRGRVLVIDFWASWCVACRLAIPTLNDWHDRYGVRGLTVVGITTDSAELALEASVELGIGYAVAADLDGLTSRAYRASAIPTLFVVDKQGTVRDVMVGYSSDRLAEVEKTLEGLISGS